MPTAATMVNGTVLIGAVLLGFWLTCGPAMASCGPKATVGFTESAPADRFEITNQSLGDWAIVAVHLRLEEAAGSLIFDTDGGGAGLSAFEPFSITRSTAVLGEAPEVGDGDSRITLRFAAFLPGQAFGFTIDIDDRVSGIGGTQVSGNEIEGAGVDVLFTGPGGQSATESGRFEADAIARIGEAGCV